MNNKLGLKIKEIRLKNKMSQEEFGKTLGYTSRSTINKIEKGEKNMSYEKIILLIKKYFPELKDTSLFSNLDDIEKGNVIERANEIIYPNKKVKSFCYINKIITNKNIVVGDYTYYDDNEEGPESFEKHVTHFYPFLNDKLIIGKFCSIAKGVEFIMNGANHYLDCISTYPYEIIDEFKGLSRQFNKRMSRGDTVIGNDVWIGQDVTILPGVHIGDGAIIGCNSVVSKNVDPYTIVAGNPIKVIRKRFDDKTIKFLVELKWWNYPIEKIKKIIPLLNSPNINDAIKKLKKL